VTDNIKRRISEHNSGSSKSTKPYRPWKVVYSEIFGGIKEAYKREKYLKSLKKRKYIEDLIKSSLNKTEDF
jgi:putative endonuclease